MDPRKTSLHSDRAYAGIRAGILAGRYGLQDTFQEMRLALEHGVSRGGVREALARLQSDRILERFGRRGYRVARMTVADLNSCFELRRHLECWAAARAAAQPRSVLVWELRRLCGVMASVQEQEQLAGAHEQFHLEIARSSGNQLLVELIGRAIVKTGMLLSATTLRRELRDHPDVSHETIVDAIEAGLPRVAGRLMAAHLDTSLMMLTRHFAGACPRVPTAGQCDNRESRLVAREPLSAFGGVQEGRS